MWMRAFNVGAIDAIRQTASMGLPNLNAQSAGERPRCSVAAKIVADANRKLAYHQSAAREASGQNDDRPCADLPDCSLTATGITSSALVAA